MIFRSFMCYIVKDFYLSSGLTGFQVTVYFTSRYLITKFFRDVQSSASIHKDHMQCVIKIVSKGTDRVEFLKLQFQACYRGGH